MARSVLFHGKVIIHPGAEAFVDLTGMVQPNVDVSQVAGIIAEAPSGQPGVLHIFADSQPATQLFGAGSDAAEAVAQILDTSPDPNVPNAPALVYVYIPSKNRQAEYWLCANPVNDIAGTPLGGLDYVLTTVAAAKAVPGTSNAYVDIATPPTILFDHFKNLVLEVNAGWGKGQQRQIKTSGETSPGSGVYRIQLRDDQDWDTLPYQSGVTTTIKILVPVIELLSTDWGPDGNQNTVYSIPENSNDPNDGYKVAHKYNNITEVNASAVGGVSDPSFTIRFNPTAGSVTPSNWFRGQSGTKSITTYTAPSHTPGPLSGTVLNGGSALGGFSEEVGRWLVATGTHRTATKTTLNSPVIVEDVVIKVQLSASSSPAFVPGEIVSGAGTLTGGGAGTVTGTFVSEAASVMTLALVNGVYGNSTALTGSIAGAATTDATPAQTGNGLFTAGEALTIGGFKATFISEDASGNMTLSQATGTFVGGATMTGASSLATRTIPAAPVQNGSGLFTVGETITGSGSGETGIFLEEAADGTITIAGASGSFQDGETLSGATSNRTALTPINQSDTADTLYDLHTQILGNMYKISSHTNTTANILTPGYAEVVSPSTNPGLGFSPGAGLMFKPMKLTDIQLKVSGRNGVAEAITIQVKDTKDSPVLDSEYKVYDLTDGGYTTLQSLRDKINEDSWLTAAIGDGVSQDVLTSRFDFGEAADSHELVVNPITDRVPMSNLIYGHSAGTTYNSLIDGPLGQLSSATPVRDNVQKLVDWINSNHGRFTASRATDAGLDNSTVGYAKEIGGGEPINFNSVFQVFYGGASGKSSVRKGATTDSDYPVSWEHGFEQMLTQDDIRVEIPCASKAKAGWSSTDIETLLTDFQTHLIDAHAARLYRNGYFGLNYPLEAGTYSGITYSKGLLEWIKSLNDENISLCGQEVRTTLTSGKDDWLPAWALACKVASIQLGTDLGEGFSLKQVLASNVRSPISDWEPTDALQSRKATLGGLLYVRPVRGTFRITRGSTTHVSTDNLARTDINVWEIRNYLIREIQILLEDRFIGAGVGLPGEGVRFVARASTASIREALGTFLEEQRAEGFIVDSIRDGRRIRAWNSLRVSISGDIARISVKVYPKVALNFILIDFAFQLPVQSG